MGAETRARPTKPAKKEAAHVRTKTSSSGGPREEMPSADPRQAESHSSAHESGSLPANAARKSNSNSKETPDTRTAYQRMVQDGPLSWSSTYTASEDAKFEYLSFTRRLRHPQCKDVATALAAQIGAMHCAAHDGASADRLSRMHHEFMDSAFMPAVRANPVWRFAAEAALSRAQAAGDTKAATCACEGNKCTGEYCEIEFLGREGAEYIMMNRLHRATFNRDAEDRAFDARIDRAVALHHAWIEPRHLEIPHGILSPVQSPEAALPDGSASLPDKEPDRGANANRNKDEKRTAFIPHKSGLPAQALFELRRVNAYTTPRDKMVCLLNGVRLVQMTVAKAADADTLMPVLIFALLKARVGRLHANLQYVRRFRSPARLAAEAYSLTCLEAAAAFIASMDASSLAISPDEYAERVQPYTDICFEAAPLSPLSQSTDSGRSSTESSPQVLDQAEAVLRTVQEKLSRSASRSMDYIGRMLDRAEDHMRTRGWLPDSGESSGRESPAHSATQADDEEAFQMRLAMALSLSEMEAHGASVADGYEGTDSASSSDDPDGKDPAIS